MDRWGSMGITMPLDLIKRAFFIPGWGLLEWWLNLIHMSGIYIGQVCKRMLKYGSGKWKQCNVGKPDMTLFLILLWATNAYQPWTLTDNLYFLFNWSQAKIFQQIPLLYVRTSQETHLDGFPLYFVWKKITKRKSEKNTGVLNMVKIFGICNKLIIHRFGSHKIFNILINFICLFQKNIWYKYMCRKSGNI